GVNALWQDIHNSYAKSSANADMYLLDVMPNFSINWKRLSLRYSENVNAPSIEYMNPVPDNTNPFAIRLSNPDLLPTKRKNINMGYYNFLPKSSLNLSINAYGSFSDNEIILARTIDERGIQVSLP